MSALQAWLKKPYDPQGMSVMYWILFLGFVTFVSLAWVHIFERHLKINSSL